LQLVSLNALFSYWLISDPDTALLSLAKIADRGLRESITHTTMQAYLFHDPREAFVKILEVPKYVAYENQGHPIRGPFRPCRPDTLGI
jgi:hypothetical protein